mmetsp:Transcript_49707/g.160734  ORF Transcript_49707/g.160734 Transcript_49707/m.160734 type:complete len:106 (-) Transcript_49707:169-486(-)
MGVRSAEDRRQSCQKGALHRVLRGQPRRLRVRVRRQAIINEDNFVTNVTGPVRFTTHMLNHHDARSMLGMSAFGCGQLLPGSPKCSFEDRSIWAKHHYSGRWRGG